MGSISNRYKVNELAKDFGMPTKQIVEILSKYFDKPKKSGQNLNEHELNVVFEYLTQHNQVSSTQVILAEQKAQQQEPEKGAAEKAEKPEKPEKVEKPEKQEKPAQKKNQNQQNQQPQSQQQGQQKKGKNTQLSQASRTADIKIIIRPTAASRISRASSSKNISSRSNSSPRPAYRKRKSLIPARRPM